MIYTTTQSEDIQKSFQLILLYFVHTPECLQDKKKTKHHNDTKTVHSFQYKYINCFISPIPNLSTIPQAPKCPVDFLVYIVVQFCDPVCERCRITSTQSHPRGLSPEASSRSKILRFWFLVNCSFFSFFLATSTTTVFSSVTLKQTERIQNLIVQFLLRKIQTGVIFNDCFLGIAFFFNSYII